MNVTELLDHAGIEYRRHGESPHVTSGWVGVICPWCGEGTANYGLGVNVAGGFCSCWSCGGHSLAALLASGGMHYAEAKRLVGRLDRVKDDYEAVPKGKYLPPPAESLADEDEHWMCVEDRGFDPEQLSLVWGVGALNYRCSGPYSWRLFIPVHYRGRPVAWTTRAITDANPPRYRNGPDERCLIPVKECVYGLDLVRNACVIHEGPTDCWATGPGAVCTFGVNYSRRQVAILSRIPRRTVCFDADAAGQSRARRLADELSCFPGETSVVTLDSGKDAASADKAEVAEIRRRFLE